MNRFQKWFHLSDIGVIITKITLLWNQSHHHDWNSSTIETYLFWISPIHNFSNNFSVIIQINSMEFLVICPAHYINIHFANCYVQTSVRIGGCNFLFKYTIYTFLLLELAWCDFTTNHSCSIKCDHIGQLNMELNSTLLASTHYVLLLPCQL